MLLFFNLQNPHAQAEKERQVSSFNLQKQKQKLREMAAGNEEWRRMADTHKMSPEEVKKAGVEASKRPPGHNAGGILHQRRNLPYSPTAMAIGGFLVVGAIGYFTLYPKKKPEASAGDVAKVATNVAGPEDTKPRK